MALFQSVSRSTCSIVRRSAAFRSTGETGADGRFVLPPPPSQPRGPRDMLNSTIVATAVDGRIGWKMIGFPGVIAVHRENIEKYKNKKYPIEPVSIVDMS